MTIKLEVELPADIFDVQVNVPLIHQVVVAQQAAARQGTAKTKTRGEVRGGGSKPYRQKGTGRARQGSIRAPQFSGGGVVHGPVPRDFSQRTPKKMKAAALRGALSDRARHGRVHVVSALVDGDTPSTRAAAGALRELTAARHVLLVADRGDELTWLSVRNLPAVHVIAPDQLNTYDVLVSDEVVFTEQGYQQFLSGPATGRSAKGAARSGELPDLATHETAGGVPSVAPAGGTVEETVTAAEPEKPAADAQPSAADTAEAPYGPGSRAATDDGGQPEGFPIKGNAGSKKYHQPGGRWYEQTAAEVWFASAADAEKAGFTEAGKSSPSAADEESEK